MFQAVVRQFQRPQSFWQFRDLCGQLKIETIGSQSTSDLLDWRRIWTQKNLPRDADIIEKSNEMQGTERTLQE